MLPVLTPGRSTAGRCVTSCCIKSVTYIPVCLSKLDLRVDWAQWAAPRSSPARARHQESAAT